MAKSPRRRNGHQNDHATRREGPARWARQLNALQAAADKADRVIDPLAADLSEANLLSFRGRNSNSAARSAPRARNRRENEYEEELGANFAQASLGVGQTLARSVVGISSILTDEQRQELGGIARSMINIPISLAMGGMGPEAALGAFTECLIRLGSFFRNNPDVAVKIGKAVVESLRPIGNFIKSALEGLRESGILGNLKEGIFGKLGSLLGAVEGVESTLSQVAKRRMQPQRD